MSALSARVSDFEADPRRLQELLGRPLADAIYRRVLGAVEIQRNDQRDRAVLDKHFAIDVIIKTSNGMVLTGQEKFLSYEYASYRSVTVEYLQNPRTGEEGDWFKLAPMVYFVGYLSADRKSLEPWALIDWTRMVLDSNRNKIAWRDNANKNGRARASFRYTRMDTLPLSCLIDSSFNPKTRIAS